ncbi:MAG TPA: hypothetical protein VGG45_11140 [Terracidiphilus sp.]
MPETENLRQQKQGTGVIAWLLGLLMLPFLFLGACFAAPYLLVLRWRQQRREDALKKLMKSKGRFMAWAEFARAMRETGGTCIEERFSAKGPVRFWWTPENVRVESPHEIIDWFTMRKGKRCVPFVLWCRERYTAADGGSAILVETWGVPKKEIYALWAECRPESNKARWVEVAPPEILPKKQAASEKATA